MALSVEWVTDRAEFEALEPEWEAILPDDRTPFELHCWLMSWWDAFGGASELAVCTVRRNGRLAAAFPLRTEGGRLKGLVNGHSAVLRPLSREEEAASAVIAAALERRSSEVELLLVPQQDPSLARLREAAGECSLHFLAEPSYVSPIVETSGEFEEWRKASNTSWKGRLARYRRKMERDHDAALDIVVAPEGLDAWLADGFRIEASGWKGEAGTAIESSPDTAAFYRDIAGKFHRRDELRLSRIVLDGEMVAFSFCILGGGRLYSLKAGFDESHRKLVPGLVIQLSIVERCFELGLDAYELLGETSDWKEKVSTASREHATVRIYPRGPAGALRHAYRSHLRPPLKRAYRRLRQRDR